MKSYPYQARIGKEYKSGEVAAKSIGLTFETFNRFVVLLQIAPAMRRQSPLINGRRKGSMGYTSYYSPEQIKAVSTAYTKDIQRNANEQK